MTTQTAQSGRHAKLLELLGSGFESYSYNAAWHAYWDSAGIAGGNFNERMLAWINDNLGASYANVQQAMQAFAVDQGYYNWDSMSTFEVFSPADLTPYSWYDPSDLSTLWQDTAGTTPVTADGQSVARIDDASGNGRHMIQSTAAQRPLYKTGAGLHWLLFDGVDDRLMFSGSLYDYVLSDTHEITAAAGHLSLSSGTSGTFWQYKATDGGESAECELAVYRDGSAYKHRTRYPSIDTATTGYALTALTSTAGVVGQERRGTSDHRQYLNGTQVQAITTASSAFDTTRRANGAGQHTSSGQVLGMRWYGLIVTAPLSSGDRALLTTWLGAKAGLSV